MHLLFICKMQQALLVQQHYAEPFGSLSYDTNTHNHILLIVLDGVSEIIT